MTFLAPVLIGDGNESFTWESTTCRLGRAPPPLLKARGRDSPVAPAHILHAPEITVGAFA
jgi:hypothetical protein